MATLLAQLFLFVLRLENCTVQNTKILNLDEVMFPCSPTTKKTLVKCLEKSTEECLTRLQCFKQCCFLLACQIDCLLQNSSQKTVKDKCCILEYISFLSGVVIKHASLFLLLHCEDVDFPSQLALQGSFTLSQDQIARAH